MSLRVRRVDPRAVLPTRAYPGDAGLDLYALDDGVLVSGVTGEGVDLLAQRIEDEFARTLREIELLIPYDEGGRLAELHEIAGDLEREETPEGVKVVARLPASVAGRYQPYALSGRS